MFHVLVFSQVMGSLREMENLALRVDEFFRRAIVLSDPSFRAT